jgi:hypothetical protein
MATERQIAANRANALKSTGPRTPEGRARSARNAFTLGLTTDQLLAPTESRSDLTSHTAELHEAFAPATPLEALLVDRIVAASWRLRRVRMQETGVYDQFVKEYAGDQNPQGLLGRTYRYHADNRVLDRLAMLEARLERSFYRALKELEKAKLKKSPIEPNLESAEPIAIEGDNPKNPLPGANPMEANLSPEPQP